jgi:hypothetical protein
LAATAVGLAVLGWLHLLNPYLILVSTRNRIAGSLNDSEKDFSDKDQENEVSRAPLIFTVPAYGFVMALYLDCLDRSNGAGFSTKTFAQEVDLVHPARPTSDGF